MSGQSLALFIFTVAIALAANRAEDLSSLDSAFAPATASVGARGPASISGKKIVLASEAAAHAHKHTAKVRGPLEASVELIGARPNGAGDVFILKGIVSSSEAVQNVEFSWRVPEELEVVNGSLKSVISSLSPEQPYEMQITLRQRGLDNGRVFLKVRGSSDGMKFGDSAQYNSMIQDVLAASRADLKKSAEEDAAQQKGLMMRNKKNVDADSVEKPSALKIFH